jgi:hypothetical protein
MVTVLWLGVAVVRTTRAELVRRVDTQLTNYRDRIEKDSGRGTDRPERVDGDATGNPSADPDPDKQTVAYLVFRPDGTKVDGKFAGFADAPLSPPRLPGIPSPRLESLIGEIHTLRSEDGSLSYRVLIERGPEGLIRVTAAPLDEVVANVRRLIRLFVIASAIALVTATGVCWFLIRHELRPIAPAAAIFFDAIAVIRQLRIDPPHELGPGRADHGDAQQQQRHHQDAGDRDRQPGAHAHRGIQRSRRRQVMIRLWNGCHWTGSPEPIGSNIRIRARCGSVWHLDRRSCAEGS